MLIKKFIRFFLPYGLVKVIEKVMRPASKCAISYSGDYRDWNEARNCSVGYDAENIISKVRDATHAVIDGKAVFERDSCLFDRDDYNYPLLSALLYVASQNDGNLNVLDFGGALGSTFWQNRKILGETTKSLTWNVVEQNKFIDAAKTLRYDAPLSFFRRIEDIPDLSKINVILCSSVLQYIENWKEIVDRFSFCDYILIDRTPEFIEKSTPQITVQAVSPEIYSASYPLWIFPSAHWQHYFAGWDLILNWVSPVDGRYWLQDKTNKFFIFHHTGVLLKRRK